MKAGDKVVILGKWKTGARLPHRTASLGYVENKRLENLRSETLIPVTDYQEPEYTSIHREHKISLGWHQVTSEACQFHAVNGIGRRERHECYFSHLVFLSDNEGNFVSIGSKDYVEQAHSRGLRYGRC